MQQPLFAEGADVDVYAIERSHDNRHDES
jgi:hypothetical protein